MSSPIIGQSVFWGTESTAYKKDEKELYNVTAVNIAYIHTNSPLHVMMLELFCEFTINTWPTDTGKN